MNHGLVRVQCESIPVKDSDLRTNDEAVVGDVFFCFWQRTTNVYNGLHPSHFPRHHNARSVFTILQVWTTGNEEANIFPGLTHKHKHNF